MNAEEEVQPILYIIYAILAIGVLWVWWLIESYTGFRIGRAPRSESVPYLVPLISMPVVAIGTWIWWKREVGIAANGVRLEATIMKLGVQASGMQSVTVAYDFGDTDYKGKISVGLHLLSGREVGDSLQLVVDRRKPKRAMVSDNQVPFASFVE